jgi:hypothetical protein
VVEGSGRCVPSPSTPTCQVAECHWVSMTRTTYEDLPLIEEHAQLVGVPAHRAWDSVLRRAPRPGLRVTAAEPPRRLVLEGSQPFSRYALVFRIDPLGHGSRVRAQTRASFRGLLGRACHALVIGTGAHRAAVRRMLRTMAGDA